MSRFVRQLERFAPDHLVPFQETERRVLARLEPRPSWGASTNEYAAPRAGQSDRRLRSTGDARKQDRP